MGHITGQDWGKAQLVRHKVPNRVNAYNCVLTNQQYISKMHIPILIYRLEITDWFVISCVHMEFKVLHVFLDTKFCECTSVRFHNLHHILIGRVWTSLPVEVPINSN